MFEDNTPPIVLGNELARNPGVMTGDTVYLISPRGRISPMGHLPGMKRFLVSAVFESGIYEFDSTRAFVHIKQAQGFLNMRGEITGIEIRGGRLNLAKHIAASAREVLGDAFTVKDWREMNRNLFFALQLEKTTMFVILALIVLVAAFNIAGALVMTVMQKKRDIAILKAMGATDRCIRNIFVLNGLITGAAGNLLGVALGVLVCTLLKYYEFVELPDIYYITTLPVQLEATDVILTAASAFVICFLATLYPARKAAQSDPAEALRYG